MSETAWRDRWDAARWFLTADGEADKAWGNETIRWHPEEGWLEVKLPAAAPVPGRKTQPAQWHAPGDQVTQDRSGPPIIANQSGLTNDDE